MKLTAIFLLLASASLAQPPTKIGPHHLGETFDEWLSASNIDLAAICGPHKGRAAADLKFQCKGLTQLRASGLGQADSFIGSQRFNWQFMNGMVAQAEANYSMPNTAQQVRFLTESYGPPASTKIVPYQNALGAKWDCLEARWYLPDGAAIMANESVMNLPYTGPTLWLTVTFLSKERIAWEAARHPGAVNPYAAK